MSKKTRLLCLILVLIFIGVTLLSVLMSIAYAKTNHPRNETVYVDADEYGKTLSMTSSVYISNSDSAQTISDETSLSDIKNILDGESPKIEGTQVVFNAEGKDVCYQGTAAGELPFGVEVSYFLNGNSISAADIAGKDGAVEIRVSSKNYSSKTVTVDGKETLLYTPFSIIAMVTFDESCTNVTSQQAKISNQAGSVVAIATLFPGLAQSLSDPEKAEENDIADKIHDSMAIRCEAKSFELSSMSFIVMSGIVDEKDVEDVDDVQDLVDGISELNDATDDLYKGAKKLRDGAEEFQDGLKEYTDGVDEVNDGTVKLRDGAKEYAQGAASYAEGVTKFNEELEKALSGLSAQAGATADPVAAATLMGVVSSLQPLVVAAGELESGAVNISGGAQSLYDGIDDLKDGVKELNDNSAELIDGGEELYDGIKKLTSGLKKMRDEGLQKMVDNTQSIDVSLARKDALLALSEDYNTFSGLQPGAEDSVQFILTTKAITTEKPIYEQPTENSGEAEDGSGDVSKGWLASIWQSIVDWFKRVFS